MCDVRRVFTDLRRHIYPFFRGTTHIQNHLKIRVIDGFHHLNGFIGVRDEVRLITRQRFHAQHDIPFARQCGTF